MFTSYEVMVLLRRAEESVEELPLNLSARLRAV